MNQHACKTFRRPRSNYGDTETAVKGDPFFPAGAGGK
jgi:hypothetical protein